MKEVETATCPNCGFLDDWIAANDDRGPLCWDCRAPVKVVGDEDKGKHEFIAATERILREEGVSQEVIAKAIGVFWGTTFRCREERKK